MFTYKNITISDIADRLKVAPSTVSRALNNDPSISEKRKKEVMALATSFGYRPNDVARNLRIKQTKTIGVIIPRLDSRFMSSALAGIEHVVNSSGYSMLVSESSGSTEKESSCAKAMFKNRPDGLLLALAQDTTELSHFDSFFRANTPVIFFHQVLNAPDTHSITIDNRQAGFEATKHLIQQGCKNILAVTPSSCQGIYLERLSGFQEALKTFEMPANTESVRVERLDQQTGTEIAKAILGMNKLPDGIFIPDDDCAVGCMLELKKGGISIPGQIAFVGFNNEPVSTVVQPTLTTIQYPAYEMGQLAATNLFGKLNGANRSANSTIVLPSELIVRESSVRLGV